MVQRAKRTQLLVAEEGYELPPAADEAVEGTEPADESRRESGLDDGGEHDRDERHERRTVGWWCGPADDRGDAEAEEDEE